MEGPFLSASLLSQSRFDVLMLLCLGRRVLAFLAWENTILLPSQARFSAAIRDFGAGGRVVDGG